MEKPAGIKLSIALGLLCTAALVWWLRSGPAPGDGTVVYFYDLSEGKLFPAPRKSFAPIAGIGGEKGDGVDAIVVRCSQCEKGNERIVFLRTHTPEYKQRNDEAEKVSAGVIEGLTREYVSENTLVRTLEDPTWCKTSTKEGIRIATSWKRRCPTHGEYEKPCLPGE